MRKREKQQILELIEIIGEAQSAGLYAEAQTGLSHIESFIKQTAQAGGVSQTIALLERHRELLTKAQNGELGEKVLRKYLVKVENSVRAELKPNKIEVVFISYNASMADSVLSIYYAAKADQNCTAVWLPVPYYEKTPDGSFGAMHYDGAECYGKDVECADWQKYDIEIRRPDIVFTFNPYDEGNYVTSIHPDFYCKKLRGLTDLLVYIPYFVVAYDVQEHFCTTSGCVYAHKVIVQSEKVRETYVRVFKETYGNRFGKPEYKFMALGSPKFDAVINAKREDFDLPDEWVRLIKNPDGSNKKIILYNARLTDMTAGIEKQLAKMKSVLEHFKTRNDVVLWFRPHPLNAQCMRAMRPHLADEYARIIEGYKRDSYGILDETSLLHRAIFLTNLYYGDESSVIPLYSATGKPIVCSRFYNAIITYDVSFNGNVAYFVLNNDNLLVSLDLKKGKISPKGFFKSKGTSMQYFATFEVGENIYFSPYNSKEIAVYSKTSETFTYISLNEHISDIPEPYLAQIIRYKDKLFFIPINFPGLLELDTQTGSFYVHRGWEEDIKKLSFENVDLSFFCSAPCVVNNMIFIACKNSNALFNFNMDSADWDITRIGTERICYRDILCNEKTFYLLGRNKAAVVIWDGTDIKKIILPHVSGNEVYAYMWLFSNDRHLWVIPAHAQRVLKIDKQSATIISDGIMQGYLSKIDAYQKKIHHACAYEDKIVIFPVVGDSLLVIDKYDDSVAEFPVYLDEETPLEIIKIYFKSYVEKNLYCAESPLLSIEKLCDLLSCGLSDKEKYDSPIELCAEKIYGFIRRTAYDSI